MKGLAHDRGQGVMGQACAAGGAVRLRLPGSIDQQAQFFGCLQNARQIAVAAIALFKLLHAVLLGCPLFVGAEVQNVKQEARFLCLRQFAGVFGAPPRQELIEVNAGALQPVVQLAVKARCGRLRLAGCFPHLSQQDLQQRGDG